MNFKLVGLSVFMAVAQNLASGAGVPALIPLPQKLEMSAGNFELQPHTRILTDAATRDAGQYLAERLRNATGYKFKVIPAAITRSAATEDILLTAQTGKTKQNAEGYAMSVTPKSVVIQ